MAKKSATSRGKQPATTLPVDEPVQPTEIESESARDHERWLPRVQVIKVNPHALVELKTALDDTVREFFSLGRHNFQVSHRHEDVRLVLGWTSVVIALGTSYYAYKVDDFQGTKSLVAIGVSLYVALNTILALYVQYYERDLIWVGKRRTIASRISTESLEISSVATSSRTGTATSSSSSWVPFPLSLLNSATTSRPPRTAAATTTTTATATATRRVGQNGDQAREDDDDDDVAGAYPRYTLTLQYTHSANANKSLLGEQTLVLTRPVADFFDVEGKIARDAVEEWLRTGLEAVTSGGRAGAGPSASATKEVESR